MKRKLFLFCMPMLLLLGFVALPLLGIAQTDPVLPELPDSESGLAVFLNWHNLVYTAIVTITGFLGSYIPGINRIPDKAWQVAAIAVIAGGIFVLLGFSKAIPLVFSYLGAVGFYDLFLKKRNNEENDGAPAGQRPALE